MTKINGRFHVVKKKKKKNVTHLNIPAVSLEDTQAQQQDEELLPEGALHDARLCPHLSEDGLEPLRTRDAFYGINFCARTNSPNVDPSPLAPPLPPPPASPLTFSQLPSCDEGEDGHTLKERKER